MFATTDNTTIVPDERVWIDQDGSVLIGWDTTNNKGAPLQIDNDTAFSTASAETGQSNLYLHNDTSGGGSGNFGPSIGFAGPGTARRHVALASVQTTADVDQVGLAIFTHPSSTGGDAVVEAVRIEHTGRVGIGDTTPDAMLDVVQSDASGAIPVLDLEQADTSEGFINFVGSDRGAIAGATNSAGSVRAEINGTVYRLALYADA